MWQGTRGREGKVVYESGGSSRSWESWFCLTLLTVSVFVEEGDPTSSICWLSARGSGNTGSVSMSGSESRGSVFMSGADSGFIFICRLLSRSISTDSVLTWLQEQSGGGTGSVFTVGSSVSGTAGGSFWRRWVGKATMRLRSAGVSSREVWSSGLLSDRRG